jgi:hypothetical protein
MAFQLSAGVNVSEIDLSTVVPSIASSIGAFAGKFAWGPANEVVTISDEIRLVERFGKPTNDNYEYWFSAANFLAYSNNLKVVRSIASDSHNATIKAPITNITITNSGQSYFDNGSFTITVTGSNVGDISGLIQVSTNANGSIVSANVVDGGSFTSVPNIIISGIGPGSNAAIQAEIENTLTIDNSIDYQLNHANTQSTNAGYGPFAAKYAGALGNSLKIELMDYGQNANAQTFDEWAYSSLFTSEPGTSDYAARVNGSNDEIHIVVIDSKGDFTGTAGAVLESFGFVSKASDAKNADGTSNYYKDVLNNRSKYIWWLDHPMGTANAQNWGNSAAGIDFGLLESPYVGSFKFGADGDVTANNIANSYSQVSNPDSVDISLIIGGPAGNTVASQIIDIAESRKDCVAFISPLKDDVVDNYGSEASSVLTYRNTTLNKSSSFAVMDSGWKYQYDKYNDTYRWVPLNADIAGLCARTDLERDPWYSPAGSNRGIIKNIIKLSWNPTKAERDDLYVKGVNPVVSFPGEGTMLFGDKTLLARPSAFDRINVRRLFIVLEKAIARAARSSLFEFNDQFTRAQFVNLVEPYLRDVQGRRGISDFRVVCDETNNTAEVIDRNEFIGDIYIKPARSINFIQLNFIAVRTGVRFEEIVGRFG